MTPEEDIPECAPDRFLFILPGILADTLAGLDQLHPPMAQHVRQDPSLLVNFPLGLHNPPSASSGESGIVIETVADPRQRVSPIRVGGLPSPRYWSPRV